MNHLPGEQRGSSCLHFFQPSGGNAGRNQAIKSVFRLMKNFHVFTSRLGFERPFNATPSTWSHAAAIPKPTKLRRF